MPPSFDEELVQRLPLPLARLYRLAHDGEDAFRRHQAAFYLWEAALKLLASAAVVKYVNLAEKDPKLARPLKNVQRATLGQWWELLRGLSSALAAAGDGMFVRIRQLLFGRKQHGLPALAELHAALRQPAETATQERLRAVRNAAIAFPKLFDCLIAYRNEFAHGAAGMQEDAFYERMGGMLLNGAEELLRDVDVLAGVRVVYVPRVERKASGDWSVERLELSGEAARGMDPLKFAADAETKRLPRPERVYLSFETAHSDNAEALQPVHPLLTYDEASGDAFFPLHVRASKSKAKYFCYATAVGIERQECAADQQELLQRVIEPAEEEPPVEGPKPSRWRCAWQGVRDQVQRHLKPQWVGALLGIACALVCWGITRFEPAQAVEAWMFDGMFLARGERASRAKEKIILLGLDDASMDALGKPWASASPELARVIEYLHEHGAAAIGVDLILRQSLIAWPDHRAHELGNAIRKTKNVVLAKWYIYDDITGEEKWMLPMSPWRLKSLIPEESQPTDLAFINNSADNDRFVRRQEMCTGVGDNLNLQFALALFAVKENYQDKVRWTEEEGLRVGPYQVPLDAARRLRINYVGPPSKKDQPTFQHVSFNQVLKAVDQGTEEFDAARFKDAVVLIGATSTGAKDKHLTPYSNNSVFTLAAGGQGLMSGTEIHANTLATLIDGAFIEYVGAYSMLAVLVLAGGTLGYVFSRLPLLWGGLAAMAFFIGWRYMVLGLFWAFHWRLELLSMLLLAATCYAAAFLRRWLRLRHMMGVVKSEAITRALDSGAATMDRRGELRMVTVLFAHVRDFTSYSHHHTAHEAVRLLKSFFAAAVPIIEQHGGTLNQYTGDGFMALFNAPEDQDDHTGQAVQAAAAIIKKVHAEQHQWRELDAPRFRIGVGVHRGEAIIGMLGSPRRQDYSAIGDTVNIAARIQDANQHAGTEILTSGEAYRSIAAPERRRLGVSEEPRLTQVAGIPLEIELHEVAIVDSGNLRPENNLR